MIKITKEHWEDPDGGKNSFQKTIDSTLYQKVEGGFKKAFTTAEIVDILSKVPAHFKDAPVNLHESVEGINCITIVTRTEVLTDGRILHRVDLRTF